MNTSSGMSMNLDTSKDRTNTRSIKHNNSKLLGNNIEIITSNNTSLKGVNLEAKDKLTLNVGNNLVVESQRDIEKIRN